MSERNSIAGENILIAGFALIGAAISITQLIAWNNAVGWDSVCYLEIADQLLHGNLAALFGSYWSPGFPLLISLIKVLSAGSIDEFLVLSLAMFCSFGFAFAAFTCFARALLRHCYGQDHERKLGAPQEGLYQVSPRLLLIAMNISFLFSILGISELSHKTPDVVASSVTFFALAQWLKLQSGTVRNQTFTAGLIGFLTGLAYWAKNFNLGWGPVFILSIIFLDPGEVLRGKKLVVLLCAYMLTMASLAVPVSLVAGRPTFSDVVKVGCAWSETVGYMGIVHGRGPSFVHPTRPFNEEPVFYEFATPYAGVTYPPFYAPQYWYEGVKFKINWPKYFSKISDKALQYGNVLGFALLLALFVVSGGGRSAFIKARVKLFAPGIVPSVFGMLIVFFMLDLEGRYYASSLVPLLCFFFACLGSRSAKRVNLSVIFLSLWMLLLLLVKTWFHFYFACPAYAHWMADISKISFPPSPAYSQHRANISALRGAGLKPGDRIARLARCGDGEFYWAKGAGLRIVCETPEVDKFWLSAPARRQELYRKLKQFGVVAIVQDWCQPSKSAYPVPSDPGWVRVPGTETYYYLLKD